MGIAVAGSTLHVSVQERSHISLFIMGHIGFKDHTILDSIEYWDDFGETQV